MNFIPSPGKIGGCVPGGLGVRIDSHCYSGYMISPYYDSMSRSLLLRVKIVLRQFLVCCVQWMSLLLRVLKRLCH